MNSMKRQKDMTLKDEPTRLVGAQYSMGHSKEIGTERMKRLSQSSESKV